MQFYCFRERYATNIQQMPSSQHKRTLLGSTLFRIIETFHYRDIREYLCLVIPKHSMYVTMPYVLAVAKITVERFQCTILLVEINNICQVIKQPSDKKLILCSIFRVSTLDSIEFINV